MPRTRPPARAGREGREPLRWAALGGRMHAAKMLALLLHTHLSATAAAPSQLDAVRGLLQRRLPAHTHQFTLEILPTDDPGAPLQQRFSVSPVAGGGVHLAGTSGVALASALSHYLKYDAQAQINVWWTAQTASLGPAAAALPRPTPVNVTSPYTFQNYLNVCAFGYSTAWWHWDRWEREIDWMALNGVVNPMAMVGQDALWLDTFVDDFGLNKTELLRNFFAGPTYQPWHWMGNLDGWGGPIDESFLRQQLELQTKITARMVQFGMRPVLPGFAGHVPAQMQRAFPDAGVTQLSPWHGHFPTGTFFLPPAASPASSALFRQIAQKFMRRQAMALGVEAWSEPHYYLADAYNEMPPSDTDPAALAAVSGGMYASMAAADSRAVMVTQGWFLRNVPAAPWGEEQARAFLQGPPLGKLLALDLEAIKNPVWQRTRSFYGIPFAFCMLHNFGERPGLFGQLPAIVSATPAALRDSAAGTMVGTGMTPEGLGTNPVVYDLFAEMFWRGVDAPDLDEWVTAYYRRRYGLGGSSGGADSCDVHAAAAWRLLSASVYSAPVEVAGGNASNWKWGDGPHSSDMAARPSLQPGRIPDSVASPYYNVSAVEAAWSALLMCSRHAAVQQQQVPLNDTVSGYTYDIVATGRQVLSDRFNTVRAAFQQAVGQAPPDVAEVKRIGADLLDMIDDMDALLRSHHAFLLGNWMADAEGWAAQSSTAAYGERLAEDARRVITLWGHPSSRNDTHDSKLSQYSYRLWAGLVKGFYWPRWEKFIAAVVYTVSTGATFDAAAQARVDQEIIVWEEQWVRNASNTAAKFGTTPRGSPTATAKSICAKYNIEGCTAPPKTEHGDRHTTEWASLQVVVEPSAVKLGPPVSPVFVGLSTETYEAVKLYGAATPRTALAQVLLNFKALTPGAKEGPVMRVGGVSADWSCWKTVADDNVSCQHCPGQKNCQSVRCCQHNISEADLDAYAAFAGIGAESTTFARLNASFALTTNLGYGPDPARAAAQVAAILRHRVLPAVSSLEIGNEVASFHDGHRSRSYSFAEYSKELSEYVAAFRAVDQADRRLPAQFLQAAVFAHPYDWSRDTSLTMPAFLQQHASATYSLCMHSYALTGVEKHAGNLSAETLLAPYCSKYHASTYAGLAADARAAGVEFVIGEGNSVSGGGQANISDVFIAALWALDFLPEISQVGAVRFNFHGGIDNRSAYAAIVLENPDDEHSPILVRPLYYGLWAFSEFVANRSRWVRSSSSCGSTVSGTCSNTAVHANVDDDGRLKVLVISKELRSCRGCSINVNVRLAGAAATHGDARAGTIAFMRPGPAGGMSKIGITWAGLTLDSTIDGKPRLAAGMSSSPRKAVKGTIDGKDLLFKLDVPQLSAAILTVATNRNRNRNHAGAAAKTDDNTVPVKPLPMVPLGAYCGAHHGSPHTNASGCLETTPIMWHGELLTVEHHQHFRVRRQAYPPLKMMSNDALITGVPGSEEVAYVSATVVVNNSTGLETLWLFGTNNVEMAGGKPRTQVHTFWSSDPKLSAASWQTKLILQLPQNGSPPPPGHKAYDVAWWTAFNTSPTRAVLAGQDAYVLAIELGSPQSVIGRFTDKPFHHRFTTVFAVCVACAQTGRLDSGWSVLDPGQGHLYRKDRDSSCPTLRYFGGYFYLITAMRNVNSPLGPKCNSDSAVWDSCNAHHVTRSRDLVRWEESPIGGNDTVFLGLPDGKDLSGPDHRIARGSLLDQHGNAVEKALTTNETDDINRSDMDMVTLPNGHTYVVWASGNQNKPTAPNPGEWVSVAGVVKGTEEQWLQSYFSPPPAATAAMKTDDGRRDAHEFDVVVFGATPGGIAAAIAAHRTMLLLRNHTSASPSVALVEPSAWIGGMAAGGLGCTDKVGAESYGGIAREFVNATNEHYGGAARLPLPHCETSTAFELTSPPRSFERCWLRPTSRCFSRRPCSRWR